MIVVVSMRVTLCRCICTHASAASLKWITLSIDNSATSTPQLGRVTDIETVYVKKFHQEISNGLSQDSGFRLDFLVLLSGGVEALP